LEELAAHATRAVVQIDTRTAATTRQGSGFLVDASGRILTNHHVIRDAKSIRIKLSSGDVYDHVAILATDDRRDIAVLQISGFDLPSLPMGNSDSVRIGAPVVLIGSPLGLENTVSTGIVSGRRQEKEGFQLFQISAPASPGSSGGPVLSRSGAVVGIASSQMDSGQNLNFAVPVNYARGLLDHLAGKPLAVLTPTSAPAESDEERPTAAAERAVNAGLRLDLAGFRGYRAEMEARIGDGRRRRTLITYRRIETVGGGQPRIERYLEREVTRRTEPFGTEQVVRRERSRTLVGADDLRPISARGETQSWTGQGWQRSTYDLRFDGDRVQGLVTDTAGQTRELDRVLPDGILLRGVRNLAFATLASDSLAGRSVDLVTFDPETGGVAHDRYDVQGSTTITVAGRSRRALKVNLASGLSNAEAYFRADRPRVLLRLERGDDGEVDELGHLEMQGSTPGSATDSIP